MRRPVIVPLGVLLFVGGVGDGVLLQRYGPPNRQAAPNEAYHAPERATVETDMKQKPKKARRSLEEDQKALLGLWVQPRPIASFKILCFYEGFVKVCDLGSQSSNAMFSFGYQLAEEGGRRHILDRDELEAEGVRVVLFTYR